MVVLGDVHGLSTDSTKGNDSKRGTPEQLVEVPVEVQVAKILRTT
jgi:hypothetical protein